MGSRLGGTAPAAIDPMAMRRVCGTYATGVAIVSTVLPDGKPCALTINSFSSVSLDPPLILWSMRSASPNLRHFEGAGPFAVSILSEEQDLLASRFARPSEDKFEGVSHRPGTLGAPIIEGSVAHLECLPHNRMDAGDHVVFVWHVVAVGHSLTRPPLTFYGGQFHRLSPLVAPSLGELQVA